jgi:hypothetical protein
MGQMIGWRCKAGHVLGLMKRNGSGAWHLLLYREALDMAPAAEQIEVEVGALVFGDATIVCSQCGEKLTWVGDPEAIRKRAMRMEKRGGA